MRVKIRYVTRRANRSGQERWYWQRPGKPLTRLPDNPIERMAMAERLNAAADNASAEPARGSIGWVIQQYRDSDEYRRLKPGTVKYYRRFLRDIEALGPSLPFASFTRRATVDFIETYKPTRRHPVASVLKNLLGSLAITGSSKTIKQSGFDLRRARRAIAYGPPKK
jgi:hypothetical protein